MSRQQTNSQRSLWSIWFEFMGSMNLAITLLVTVAIASVIGTVLVQNEPYINYRSRFGEFWFNVFEKLGLYDVYTAGWFLFILAFLVLSTSICVVRNTPHMLREIKNYRLNAQRKSLLAFHHKQEYQTSEPFEALQKNVAAFLTGKQYRFRVKQHEDHMLFASMRGAFNRVGYIFAHVSIVIICIGGLVDGNVGLKWKVINGDLQVQKEDMLVSKIPEVSRLKPGDSLSFRGNRTIPEGSTINAVVLDYQDGFVLQELPFAIEVSDFRIEYYPTGQPKSFQSDLIIHDDDLKEPMKQTIAVNHPLVYKGYSVYQATFGDGGSLLDIKAWPLMHSAKPVAIKGEVNTSQPLKQHGFAGQIEYTDFRMFNIVPADEGSEKKFTNQGPSFIFKVRNAAGEANEYVNYMQAVERNGLLYLRSDVRKSLQDGFQTLWLPLDKKGELNRFMQFRQLMLDKSFTDSIILRQAEDAFKRSGSTSIQQKESLKKSMLKILQDFNSGELNNIMSEMARNLSPEAFKKTRKAYLTALQGIVLQVYVELLRREGVDISQGITDKFDQMFFDDAFVVLGAIPNYESPFYFQLTTFKQIEATGLQITRAPGTTLVYLGCVLLIIGVFIMFYVHHKRIWVYIEPGEKQSRIILAGSSQRKSLDFDNEFAELVKEFRQTLV